MREKCCESQGINSYEVEKDRGYNPMHLVFLAEYTETLQNRDV